MSRSRKMHRASGKKPDLAITRRDISESPRPHYGQMRDSRRTERKDKPSRPKDRQSAGGLLSHNLRLALRAALLSRCCDNHRGVYDRESPVFNEVAKLHADIFDERQQ